MATPQPFKDFIVRYRKGDVIYATGDPGTEMYIVQSGAVEIYKETDGARVSLAVMEKGDFFGEMALIESAPHSSNAAALEDCELIEINSTLFDRMIKGNIEIAVRMLRKLSIRLRDALRRLEEASMAAGSTARKQSAATLPEIPDMEEPPPRAAANEEGIASGSPESSGQTPPMGTEELSESAALRALPPGERPSGCHAVLLSEDGKEMFHVISTKAAIGRFDPVTGLKPEVDLSALDLNRSVSRHHARLTLEGGVYNVTEEVGALNGTFINGKKLVSGKSTRLRSGDVLSLGMVKLFFQEISG